MANSGLDTQYIVGAYTTSPNLYTWNEKSELSYLKTIKSLKSNKGLQEAINFYLIVYKCVNVLKKRFSENAVTDITITSSPYVRKEIRYSSVEKFITSLIELVS